MSPALDAPASKPRPRNRLRKLTRLRPGPATSPPANNSVSPRASSDSGRAPCRSQGRSQGQSQGQSQSPRSPRRGSIPPSPDLSSQKWLEYIRKSGYLCPMEESPHLQHTRSRSLTHRRNTGVVPELAHLAIDMPEKGPRRSSETQRATGSPRSASSSLRRYAKTPVLRVGQLEANEAATQGAESIAEQYRALLTSRSSHDDLHHGDGGGAGDGAGGNDADTRQTSIEAIRGATRRRSPLPLAPWPSSMPGADPQLDPDPSPGPGPEPRGSPTSDGTLVAFEEDTIFFKPVSFWPEPLSPIREGGGRGGDVDRTRQAVGRGRPERPAPQPGVLSLQIATNLLSRELSCAVSNEALRAPTDVRQLQVWVMIEAYEALRDQVLQMALAAEEREALEGAFGVWLRALYRIHDGFARETSGPSDSDVEAMQAEDLD